MSAQTLYLAGAGAADYESVPTRSSLLSRLRNVGDEASWRLFFETYWRLIYNVARKSGLEDADAQDVVQETVIAVARRMPEFRYDPSRGSFKHWLLLITRRRLQDHLRRRYRSLEVACGSGAETTGKAPSVENLPAPGLPPDAQLEAAWEEEWQENFFQAALTQVRQQTKPKHYQVFDCCVLQGVKPAAAARMLGLSAAQVYLANHRISSMVKRIARELEAEAVRSAGAKS